MPVGYALSHRRDIDEFVRRTVKVRMDARPTPFFGFGAKAGTYRIQLNIRYGREHPEDPNPSWMGHSIGRWEGDTLVIDTIGFNDRGWMSIYPRSEELHIVERLTRTKLGRMDLEVTIEDPKVFKKSWVSRQPAYLAPDVELIGYVCENNKW